MGFWGTLGKVGLGALGVVGAPYTGGASLGLTGKVLSGIGKAAPILAGASGSAAKGKREDENSQLSRDALELRKYEMDQAAPGKRLTDSTRASMVKNATPVTSKWGGPGSGLRGETVKYSGGYANPDLIDPRSKQLADSMLTNSLQQQLSGAAAPDIAGPPKSSVGDKILGGVGLGGSILGAILPSITGGASQPGAMPTGTAEDDPYGEYSELEY